MKTSSIKIKVKSLPALPGVYQFFNQEGVVIYIGKAKNLKKRAASYFTKNHENNRVKLLVKNIHKIETIVVDTEIRKLVDEGYNQATKILTEKIDDTEVRSVTFENGLLSVE